MDEQPPTISEVLSSLRPDFRKFMLQGITLAIMTRGQQIASFSDQETGAHFMCVVDPEGHVAFGFDDDDSGAGQRLFATVAGKMANGCVPAKMNDEGKVVPVSTEKIDPSTAVPDWARSLFTEDKPEGGEAA